MRHLRSILIMFTFFIATLSCKKGETGPEGPQGITGNADVIMYTFNGPYSITYGIDLSLSNITKERMDSSLVLAYYSPAAYNTNWYPIPGVGGYGASVQFQTIYDIHPLAGNKCVFALRLFNPAFTAYNGSTVVFNKIKVIVATASSIVPGGRRAGDLSAVDLSDYHAVMKYFDLPE